MLLCIVVNNENLVQLVATSRSYNEYVAVSTA
jgi:hypothetical protein